MWSISKQKSLPRKVAGSIIFQPINRTFPLRYLEEKYGLSSNHKEAGLVVQERRSQNRLSLNIPNGHDVGHNVHDGQHCEDNGFVRGSQLRSVRLELKHAKVTASLQIPLRLWLSFCLIFTKLLNTEEKWTVGFRLVKILPAVFKYQRWDFFHFSKAF